MSYLFPTIPEFKEQFARDFPFASPLTPSGTATRAEVVAVLNASNQVGSFTVVSGGSGYPSSGVLVIVYGGGGIRAAGAATVVSGVVTAVVVTNPGVAYVSAPSVYVPLGGDNTQQDKVADQDIARSFTAAYAFNVSRALFSTQQSFTYAMNLLAAHYLCELFLGSGAGLAGTASWATQAKTVGNVTESFVIPKRFQTSPLLMRLGRTTYGAQFLELVSPALVGNVRSFFGGTLP